MYGRSIEHTDGVKGDGVFITSDISSNKGTFNMYGGSITGNKASQGGGLYNEGTFTMNDGEISENRASGLSGGVENEGTFAMKGGRITGNSANIGGGVRHLSGDFQISGHVTITGNKEILDQPSNLCLEDGYIITLTDELDAQTNIGITMDKTLEDVDTVTITSGGRCNISNFLCDNSRYTISLTDDNNIKLVYCSHSNKTSARQAATCTEDGWNDYYHCPVCGKDKWNCGHKEHGSNRSSYRMLYRSDSDGNTEFRLPF